MYIVRHDYTISFLEAKHQQQRINKLDIVAVTVLLLMHIEWSHGNAYSFFYIQITDWDFITDLVLVRPELVNIYSPC